MYIRRLDSHQSVRARHIKPTAVTAKVQILLPVSLISCTFMPKMEEAKLMGMKAEARTVTGAGAVIRSRSQAAKLASRDRRSTYTI